MIGPGTAPARDRPDDSRHRIRPYSFYAIVTAGLGSLFVGLYVSHYGSSAFAESVERNHRLTLVAHQIANASAKAGEIDSPGNDIFVSRDAASENLRLRAAQRDVEAAVHDVRTALEPYANDPAAARVLASLDRAWIATLSLAAQCGRVLDLAGREQWDDAAVAMAELDRVNRTVRADFDTTDVAMSNMQEALFERGLAKQRELRRLETIVGTVCTIMLCGSVVYGRRMYRVARERAVIAAAQDMALATAEYAADGTLITANANFLSMTGYTLDELRGCHHRTLCDRHTAESADYEQFWTDLADGRIQTGRYKRVDKHGSPIWIDSSYYPVRTGSGTPEKIVEFTRNLTTQTAADAERRALAAIVDASDDAIIGKDLFGVVTSWNAGAERLFGYSAAEIVGKSDERILAKSGIAERAAVTARLLRGERVDAYETRKFKNDGTSIAVQISAFAVRDESDNVIGIGEIVRDITERKRAEVALLVLKEGLDQHSIVAITDTRGKITYVNDKFCEVSQYSREELIGRDHRLVNSGYHSRAFIQDLWTTIKAGHTWKGEIQNRAKDGTPYWVDTTIVPVRDDSGEVVQFMAVRTDVTQRKKDAQLLEQAAREVERRNEELARANVEALAATKAKSEFLATMSHEIRTPMNAIVGMADLLAESHLEPEQHEYVRRLNRAAANLLELINDVLDISKIEARAVASDTAPFDIHALVDDIGELLATRAFAKPLEFVTFVHPDVPSYVMGDQTRLRQVLVNLAGNAVKFTRRGEVVVRVEPAPDADGTTRLRFSVSDTGMGIPADKLSSIFDPFTQVDASTTRKFGGTGLGLTISKGLVELMGGQLEVRSAPACGSTFSFTLPLVTASGRSGDVQPPCPDLRGRTFVVVEPHESARVVLRHYLSNAGAEVAEATDAESALAALEACDHAGRSAALVLIDDHPPDIDGIAVAKAISERPANERLPLVLCSAQPRRIPDDGASAPMRRLGQLSKPVSRRRLLQSLCSALDLRPSADTEMAGPAPVQQPEVERVRILVIDDAEENREVISLLLKGGPYDVDTADSGATGVAKFRESRYDLVFMDMHMPGMDGYEATAIIREWERIERRTPTPIVAATASAFQEDVELALAAGCTAHVAKPIRKAVLLKAISVHASRPTDRAA